MKPIGKRFPDLRTVYAFDGVDNATDEADARWSTVAVHPITYQNSVEELRPHETLWRDLELLADLIEWPKPTRRRMANEILSKSYDAASALELDQIGWLLKGRGDLWDIVITKIQEPAWFDHFSRQELWQPTDPTWVLPAWFANRWTDLEALRSAALWFSISLTPDLLDRALVSSLAASRQLQSSPHQSSARKRRQIPARGTYP